MYIYIVYFTGFIRCSKSLPVLSRRGYNDGYRREVLQIQPIYIICLSVMMSVCLFLSTKRQNGWTEQAQILFVLHMFPGEVYRW